jgi:hypothetical protein
MRSRTDARHPDDTLTRIDAWVEEDAVGHAAIATQSERRRWMSLALVVTAQFMVILDATIVNLRR